jgi:hypothetical protein
MTRGEAARKARDIAVQHDALLTALETACQPRGSRIDSVARRAGQIQGSLHTQS